MINIKERLHKDEQERIEHRRALSEKYGVPNHPKLHLLYEISWREGHSGGFGEMENYFSELVELIKP